MAILPTNWSALADSNGTIDRVIDTSSGLPVSYDVSFGDDGTPEFFDSDGNPSDLNGALDQDSLDSLSSVDTNTNFGSLSDEDRLYQENIETMTDRDARIQAKIDANGISYNEASKIVGTSIAYEQINAPLTPDELELYKSKDADSFRVILKSQITGDTVRFFAQPNIDENRTASYDSISPIHHPGPIHIYKTTGPRVFNINGKFISRNVQEATRNVYYQNIIRSWVMPYYGKGTAQDPKTKSRLGAPPDILTLSAYGEQQLDNIPVVLTSYSWSFTDNVDYIPTQIGDAEPRILDITIGLMEVYSPEEYSNFDLNTYKAGFSNAAFRSVKSTRDRTSIDENSAIELARLYAKRNK